MTYADSDGVDKVIEFGSHELDGKKVSRDLFDCLELLTKKSSQIDPKVAFPKRSNPKVIKNDDIINSI